MRVWSEGAHAPGAQKQQAMSQNEQEEGPGYYEMACP